MRTFHARLGALVAVLSVVAVLAAPAAVAAGGNSANAQECQKVGWQDWVREDGTAFKNTGSCVAFGASGGVLIPLIPLLVCYDATTTAHDLAVVGPIDTLDNAALYSSVNGSCSGGKVESGTVVRANKEAQAVVKCGAIVGAGSYPINLNTVGYSGAPSDWWGCLPAV